MYSDYEHKFEFKRIHGPITTSIVIEQDMDLDDLFLEFENFLRGCGYSVEGTIGLTGEEK